MENLEDNVTVTNAYQCDGCGAPLVYKPGSSHLYCSHCGTTKEIDKEEYAIDELDFNTYIENYEDENFSSTKVVTCSNCKATPTVNESLKSMHCPYCGSPLVEDNVHQERYIKPAYVLPFEVDRPQVNTILTKWINSLWFAPNNLKKAILTPVNLNGIYLPYWTYDAHTQTTYTGQRGDDYTVTVGSGKNRRTETRTRWSFASGTVRNFYDDVLVVGTKTLDDSILNKVGGWNTKGIIKINDGYLAGFITEKYQVDIKQAFVIAREIIKSREREAVKRDIGGDRQRINTMNTKYFDVTFKHILLPIYASAFHYKNKIYTFYVNGATGRISGKRPYSVFKIALAIIAGLIAVGVFVWLINGSSTS